MWYQAIKTSFSVEVRAIPWDHNRSHRDHQNEAARGLPRDFLVEFARISRVELHPKVQGVRGDSWKQGYAHTPKMERQRWM